MQIHSCLWYFLLAVELDDESVLVIGRWKLLLADKQYVSPGSRSVYRRAYSKLRYSTLMNWSRLISPGGTGATGETRVEQELLLPF
jgi:hypothetical protein